LGNRRSSRIAPAYIPHLKIAQLLNGERVGHIQELPHILVPLVLLLLLLLMLLLLESVMIVGVVLGVVMQVGRRMCQLLGVALASHQLLALLHADEVPLILD